ncbi:MAG TPA: ABC transporter substrate-binding protein, partial [Terriglobales bacterium]|nr:ABC transporter substrate-binding protein [Terriglobales bacterium]
MQRTYWSKVLKARLSRRRALIVAGTSASAASFIVACGGSSNGRKTGNTTGGAASASTGSGSTTSAPSGAKNSLVDVPLDTTAQAKPGGTLKHWADGDAVHDDALASNANGVINWISAFAYPRMLRNADFKYPKAPDGTLEGETARSFEYSPDKLTLTFKIRQGMKWDAREPTNGRLIDAQDVLFSWNKFATENQSAGDMSSKRTPEAPIDSVTAPDNETIVMKLNKPDSSLLPLFASWDHFYQMPRESDGGFDPKQVVRGHGPWMLDEYVPSVRYVWAKNPDYFIKGRPFPDKLERPIIPEYSSRLAQFKTGAVLTNVALPIDVIQAKKDLPKTSIHEAGIFSTTIWYGLSFGYNNDSPFKDTRVRQAASMLVDGDGYVDVIDNRKDFREAGMDVPTAFNSVVAAGWNDFWLDPTNDAKFGPNAKYLHFNVEEAKKLLAAAGYPNGFDYDIWFSNGLYGPVYQQSVDLISGMLNDGGMRATQKGLPYEQYKNTIYEAYWGPSYSSGKTHGFNGIVHLANPTLPTVVSHLYTFCHKDGGRFHGFTPDGNNPQLGDPKLNSDIEKLKLEFDHQKQISMVQDIARYFTGYSYYVPRKAQIPLVEVIWPAVQNYGVLQRAPGD